MPLSLQIVLSILVGYLLGSISFAILIAKRHGVDIFKEGSRNPGATNVKRVLGKKAGNTVFFLDFLKGAIAALLPLLLASAEHRELLAIVAILGAIAGHSFSIFLKFRGGKGVATTMGGFLALAPYVLLTGLVLWVVVFYSLRYVSLASIIFGLSLPVSAYFFGESKWVLGFCALISLLLIVRHKSNIVRLLNGTENRFSKRPGKEVKS
ncbi:MAG: glycerol-3-phosphate 1-O-acyltransferase PlsY [Verrucomicrobiae bacterium]|nr:glycerol-3-phosphate 1-O-acyltransferase PlsY [Verrucomicrobiae bacterium]